MKVFINFIKRFLIKRGIRVRIEAFKKVRVLI